jgi:hypothetical protein
MIPHATKLSTWRNKPPPLDRQEPRSERLSLMRTISIKKALKANTSLEARRRLEQILNKVSGALGQDTLRNIRAIMALSDARLSARQPDCRRDFAKHNRLPN